MPVNAEALRELHRIHRQLTDLRTRLERGPRQIRIGEGNVNRTKQERDDLKEALTRARVNSNEKNLQLKQREDRIEELKKKLNTASSNKEFQAIKDQIAADEQANSVLSDEILEGLEKIDELQEQVAEADNVLGKAGEDLAKVKADVTASKADLESELARVEGELERAEKELPADFKADYQRVTKARGEDALAEVQGECCGACFQTLTPQTMNELSQAKPVNCKSCGALLYLPEDRSL